MDPVTGQEIGPDYKLNRAKGWNASDMSSHSGITQGKIESLISEERLLNSGVG